MRRIYQLLAATTLVVVGGTANSQPSVAAAPVVAVKEATSEVAFELAECAAYYTIAAAAIDVSLAPGPDRELRVAEAKRLAVAALRESEQLTSNQLAAARMDLAWETMIRQMDRKWENFSVVTDKYDRSCEDRMAAPDRRLAYWLAEKVKVSGSP